MTQMRLVLLIQVGQLCLGVIRQPYRLSIKLTTAQEFYHPSSLLRIRSCLPSCQMPSH